MAGGISYSVSVQGLNELIGRLKAAPAFLQSLFPKAMNDSLDALHESTPPYPPERQNQKYVRTEKLGQSLGSGFGGGKVGKPDIFEVKASGGAVEGRIGSRLGYAEYPIGEGTQAWMHVGRWWTVRTWFQGTWAKIQSIWQAVGSRVAIFVNGK